MYRSIQRAEIDPNLIEDFSSEAPVADFPQTDLEPLKATVDIDWDGHGVYTLRQPMECPCCSDDVTWTRGHQETSDGETILTCPHCLQALGTLEEN